VHGSKAIARDGFTLVSYDARGHGESDPAEQDQPYDYPRLVADLGRVVASCGGEGRPVLAGHSMGAHTIAAFALADPDAVGAAVLICPASTGTPLGPDDLADWDSLAAGLEQGGVEGFLSAYDDGLDPQWRDTLLRIARDRLSLHRHPEAVARALREVPRSMPFDGMDELERLEVPALVIASRDEADPGHPREVGEEWAQRIPGARFLIEDEGSSPLAWQGGRLSKEIAAFCREPEVAARLRA
jgi:pimeloyl-ACP methyl ester carboxylesterase